MDIDSLLQVWLAFDLTYLALYTMLGLAGWI